MEVEVYRRVGVEVEVYRRVGGRTQVARDVLHKYVEHRQYSPPASVGQSLC